MLPLLFTPVCLLPDSVHTGLMSHLINHLLRGQAVQRRLVELDGKVISLVIDDLGIELSFRLHEGYLYPAPETRSDVRIRGKSDAFVALALRRQDPDTLFFQRKLSVEGETETGVHIKNIIDGFDFHLQNHLNATLPPAVATVLGRLIVRARSYHHRPPTPGDPRQ